MTLVWADNRRRDPGNWYPTAKAIVDGLVDAGILIDDDHTKVVGPDMRQRTDKTTKPHIEITLKEDNET